MRRLSFNRRQRRSCSMPISTGSSSIWFLRKSSHVKERSWWNNSTGRISRWLFLSVSTYHVMNDFLALSVHEEPGSNVMQVKPTWISSCSSTFRGTRFNPQLLKSNRWDFSSKLSIILTISLFQERPKETAAMIARKLVWSAAGKLFW